MQEEKRELSWKEIGLIYMLEGVALLGFLTWPLTALLAAGTVWIGIWMAVAVIILDPRAVGRFVLNVLRAILGAIRAWNRANDLRIAENNRRREAARKATKQLSCYSDTVQWPDDWSTMDTAGVRKRLFRIVLTGFGLLSLCCLASFAIAVCALAVVAFCPRCTDPSLLGVASFVEDTPTSGGPALMPEAPATELVVEPLAQPAAVISSTGTITTTPPLVGIVATGTPAPTHPPETTATSYVVEAVDTVWAIMTALAEKFPTQEQITCVLWANDLHRQMVDGQPVVRVHQGNGIFLPDFCFQGIRSSLSFTDPRDDGRLYFLVPKDDVLVYVVKDLGRGNFHVAKLRLGYVPMEIQGLGFVREGLFQHTSPLTLVVSFKVEGMEGSVLDRQLDFDKEIPIVGK